MAGNVVIKFIQKNWKIIAGFLGGAAATGIATTIIYKIMIENAKNEGFKLGYEEAARVYNEVVKAKVRELELYKGDFSKIKKEYDETIEALSCLIRSLEYEMEISKKHQDMLEELLDDKDTLLRKYAAYAH